MVDQKLDFRGTVTLDAAVSELTTGFKSTLVKLVDPLFRKENAGARISITVTGTTNDPKLGLDVGRLLSIENITVVHPAAPRDAPTFRLTTTRRPRGIAIPRRER